MKPVEFPGVNVVFAKDQPEYMPLPAMKNAANCPFKVGEKVIFALNRSGIIEKIYANDYGDFSYDIRTIKKDGEPSKIIVHTNTWDKIYKA
nr:MAG: hypothetical protein [Bacteriophage sp.]